MIDNIQNEITLQLISTGASERLARSYLPNDAQPSEVEVPTTSTSLINKGKSRQASSLSEESPDTAKSSEPSMSDSSSCLPNELPSSSLPSPPLHSVAVSNDAISVNLEDDTEDDSSDFASYYSCDSWGNGHVSLFSACSRMIDNMKKKNYFAVAIYWDTMPVGDNQENFSTVILQSSTLIFWRS